MLINNALNEQLIRCVSYYNISLLSLYPKGYVLVASTCHLLRKASVEEKSKQRQSHSCLIYNITFVKRHLI